MIVGLGTDIVSIERIAKLLSRNETTFIEKICSANEKKYLQSCADITPKLAKLWAVKEAAVKALGTGFVEGITFKDIELKHNNLGRPEVELKGKALQILEKLTSNSSANILVSLSDDKPWAQAIVIIEKI
ncbi:MAG: holo-ACP synthase [Alphaproteobacteria bacterium]|nr:holo-ACP synthase [Alphaproteobacteria bacterium]